ncbi:unnamed protein product [Didymodactylos carnosus]|uniref:Uncharacterized protein n=1 Tax=Didymodactylos carnosus TaxID=1234261 RepID=A0A8S2QHB1_9BILA|nr:unnamed protein product [Didymodactylos carnosus]CAF4099334.1 unnamed protein product [Didymodactylos carnosus]
MSSTAGDGDRNHLLLDKMDLKGKNIVITGASSGIGEHIALTLAKEGCNLALLARTKSKLDQIAEKCRSSSSQIKIHVLQCDMSEKLSVDETCKQIGSLFNNEVHVLINNAGIMGEQISSMEEKTKGDGEKDVVDMWEEVMMVNLVNLMRITNRCLQFMKKIEHGAAIITISSVAATMTGSNLSHYHASKWGVNGFLGSIYEDVRQYGIKVCSIMPGMVNTPMLGDFMNKVHVEKCIQPDDIAQGILYVLKTPYNVCPTEIKYRPQYSPYRKE